MGCEITTCSFVTAPLTSHSQPVPDRRKELFLFVTALEQVQRNLAPRLFHRLRCNRSGVTLLLVSLSHAALEQVQSNLVPRLCDKLRCNRSGATLFLYAPKIFWCSRTVERKWIRFVLVTALRSVWLISPRPPPIHYRSFFEKRLIRKERIQVSGQAGDACPNVDSLQTLPSVNPIRFTLTAIAVLENNCLFCSISRVGMSMADLTMGKHFGELAYLRGIVQYRLSPFEQRAFAGAFTKGLWNIPVRIRASIFRVAPPFILGYLVYSSVERKHEQLMRKNPDDFKDDE
uniref:Cytochrome b-c1 complex subunit 8 n=3 Tax=Timema TaxID=61471 RepID=A0A7R9FKN3_9NEOP|nr:unnamed protein product [Timema tahoe]